MFGALQMHVKLLLNSYINKQIKNAQNHLLNPSYFSGAGHVCNYAHKSQDKSS